MADSNSKSPIPASSTRPSIAVAWRPGLRQTPWPAVILITIVLACMGASASIIFLSEKQTVGSWKVQPTVLLAVLSSVLNSALSITLSIGVVITWWRSVLHGTTMERLHHIWNRGAGLSLPSALKAGRDARKVALLAALVTAVQFINNPLLQRSTHIIARSIAVNEMMTLDIAERLPDGFSGSIQNASIADTTGSRDGLSDIQGWWWNQTITTSNKPGYYCDGTCEGKVRGGGISYSCNSTTRILDFSAKENEGTTVFAINTTLSSNSTGAPILVMTTQWASGVNGSCMAEINVDTCIVEAAVVEYPIRIQNTTVTLEREKLKNMTAISTYISPGDLPTATKGQGAGPLEGLNNFFGFYLGTNVTLIIDLSRNETLYSGGLFADLFFRPGPANYDSEIFHKCGLSWTSPTEYFINSMHDFMFRGSLSAGKPQAFTSRRTNSALIFHSDYRYLSAALVIMLFALLAVLSLLWGWWELGRNVSLSPLEIVKAFGTPIMRDAGGHLEVGGILGAIGKKNLGYDGEKIRDEDSIMSHNSADPGEECRGGMKRLHFMCECGAVYKREQK